MVLPEACKASWGSRQRHLYRCITVIPKDGQLAHIGGRGGAKGFIDYITPKAFLKVVISKMAALAVLPRVPNVPAWMRPPGKSSERVVHTPALAEINRSWTIANFGCFGVWDVKVVMRNSRCFLYKGP